MRGKLALAVTALGVVALSLGQAWPQRLQHLIVRYSTPQEHSAVSPDLRSQASLSPSVGIMVHDVLRLNEAIASAPAGAAITLAAGDHWIAYPIVIDRDDVILRGEGSATRIHVATGALCPGIVLGKPAPYDTGGLVRSGIVLQDLYVDGNRLNQPSELCGLAGLEHLRNNCVTGRRIRNCTISNVLLTSARSGGLVLELPCEDILVENSIMRDCHFDGTAWDAVVTRSILRNCRLIENLASGVSFDLGVNHCFVIGCDISNNLDNGIFMRESNHNVFRDCVVSGNRNDGAYIADGEAPTAATTHNTFSGVSITANTRSGILQDGSRSINNTLDGVFLQGNGGGNLRETHPSAPLVRTAVTDL